MSIRPYRAGDYLAILDIYASSKLDELRFEGRAFSLVPLEQDLERLANFERSTVFVHEQEAVVAYAAHMGGEITALFVHPQARGRGIGKRLLEFMLQRMPGPVTLHVAKSNRVAKGLYEQYGFRVVGEFETSYAELNVMAQTMQRVSAERKAVPIIEIAAAEVRAIPIEDCGEPLIDVGIRGTISVGPPPECPGTAPHYRLLRQGVVERLERAQSRLPGGLRLRLYEGYRSPLIQDQLFQAQRSKLASDNPGWAAEKCYLEASKLISPLRTLQGDEVTTPHSTGGAVDMEIIDATGKVLDFGMEARDWPWVAPELCETRYPGISRLARQNRELLVEVLESEGFVNYPREWWHFSYGDPYWAANTGRPAAIYGRV